MTSTQRNLTGAAIVVLLALLSWLTILPGTPQIYAPLNLLVMLPAFLTFDVLQGAYICVAVAVVPFVLLPLVLAGAARSHDVACSLRCSLSLRGGSVRHHAHFWSSLRDSVSEQRLCYRRHAHQRRLLGAVGRACLARASSSEFRAQFGLPRRTVCLAGVVCFPILGRVAMKPKRPNPKGSFERSAPGSHSTSLRLIAVARRCLIAFLALAGIYLFSYGPAWSVTVRGGMSIDRLFSFYRLVPTPLQKAYLRIWIRIDRRVGYELRGRPAWIY